MQLFRFSSVISAYDHLLDLLELVDPVKPPRILSVCAGLAPETG
jgi:hypothetical protein